MSCPQDVAPACNDAAEESDDTVDDEYLDEPDPDALYDLMVEERIFGDLAYA